MSASPTRPPVAPSTVVPRRWPAWAGALTAALVVGTAFLLDRAAYDVLVDPRVYERDWGRLLRVMGYLPLWLLLGLVLARHDVASRWHGAALALAPALGGLAAEGLKLLLRRERPPAALWGDYVFRPFSVDPWSTRGLGLPSSHTLVAMAAATVLAQRFPRGRWVWYGLAVGCGVSRVAARAHWLSDVAVALVVGWGVGQGVWRFAEGRNAQRAGTP